MFKIFRYLKGFKKQLIIGPAFKLTEAVFELIVPLVMASIIDIGAQNGDVPYILKMGGLMLLLGALGLVCALICQYNAAKASQGFGTVVRNELFSHINSLSAKELDKIGSSGLINRMTNDVNQLQLAVAMLIRLVIRAPFLVIGATAISIGINFKLSIIFLITIPVIVLVLYLIMNRSIPLFKAVQKQLDKIALVTRENLAGARVIRAFVGQKRETKRFRTESGDLKAAAVRVGRLSAMLSPLTYIIINIAIIAIVWLGSSTVFKGIIGIGDLIALVQYMTQILLALIVVADLVIIFTKAAASAKRVNEVFDMKPSITYENTSEISIENANTAVEFKNVSFSYGGDGETALENLNFSIKVGQTVGIIGGTGSGKSTLVKLINRTYDPTAGEVSLFEKKLPAFSKKQLHSLVHIVLQKALLFSGTIRSNLKMGADEADISDEKLFQALQIAQASDFVNELSQKLDSPVSQGGKNFSGGQRQRLTIARALVGNPKLLILDDSSSALDYKTDFLLRKAIKDETENTTVILISQRYASIEHADFIIVLDDGAIVGIGTHQELLENCEAYREICTSQQASTASSVKKEVV